MRWTSRLRRHGGMANIIAARQRQTRLLVKALRGVDTLDAAPNSWLEWLAGNEVRCLSPKQEEAWSLP
jgi:hypothetical protein